MSAGGFWKDGEPRSADGGHGVARVPGGYLGRGTVAVSEWGSWAADRNDDGRQTADGGHVVAGVRR